MLVTRNGQSPRVHPSAQIAPSAQVIGNVTIGEHCHIDYNVVIESSGVPVQIEDHVIVFANSVIRSVGGTSRPPFPISIGSHTLVSPLCSLVGCQVGHNCYIATGVIIFQGAVVGDDTRVGAGAIVHVNTQLPPGTRVGMRHIAVPEGDSFLTTADVQAAREKLAKVGFFKTVFDEVEREPGDLHQHVIERLLQEAAGWEDELIM